MTSTLLRLLETIAAAGLLVGALLFDPISAEELEPSQVRPASRMRPVALEEVQWTSGFWADRFATCRTKSIPAMWDIMQSGRYKPFLGHFLIAAGRAEGDYHGAPWNDGDFYKFLEGATAAWAVSRDPKLEQILDASIDAVAAAQRADGYLHTPVLVRHRNGDNSIQPFQDRADFEMYNMGHLITAACVHHRVTGRDDFLQVARKTADFLVEAFRQPTNELARNSVCPSHYMAMVELYRTTGDRRYLDLARTFLEMRDLVTDGDDDNQDRVPFLEQNEAVGHAVRANYLYAGATDLFLETGDERLWPTLDRLWHNVVNKKMYVTGACGALYDGASPDGAEEQATITRIHQAYGRNYQLPNATAHNETCAAIGNVLWNWRMFLATGDAKYIDVVELALYNAVLPGVSLDGDDYFYVNPLRQVEPLPTPLRWSRTRVPFVASYCCPPNVVRTIASVNGYAYCKSDDEITVNLYGGSTYRTKWRGESLKLKQETEYPWNGRVRITVEACPPGEWGIKLRVPGWADSAAIAVNGESIDAKAEPGTFAAIRRTWKPGDVVELNLPMPVVLLESHPLVEENRHHTAVKRGPIVYCLESPDLPDGVRVQDVVLRRDATYNAKRRDELLGGVTVIEADATARRTGDWNGRLYRPLQPAKAESKSIALRLIPYYAWSNRGASEMTVWMPFE
ncbi:MAG: glycoside hydrolase family 127 protein [Pirellulales bacterium]|nr:glycoside hydrolase family 127 protein [Pirellulales bacterium]